MSNILVVEDENFLTRVLEDNLIAEGYIVDSAKNGEEALKKIEKKKPDLVLLDILMPKSDGFYALKKIKTNPRWKSIPVIVLSNLGEEMVLKQALETGANDYFIKSEYSIEKVIKEIKNYL